MAAVCGLSLRTVQRKNYFGRLRFAARSRRIPEHGQHHDVLELMGELKLAGMPRRYRAHRDACFPWCSKTIRTARS